MAETDRDGWQRYGWLHINPDVKERLKRIELRLDALVECYDSLVTGFKELALTLSDAQERPRKPQKKQPEKAEKHGKKGIQTKRT